MTGQEPRRRVAELAVVLHRAALLAYPPAFRREFGAEIERVFAERLAGAHGGRAGPLALFLLADTVLSGAAERLHARGTRWAWPRHPSALQTPGRLAMTIDSLAADFTLALRQMVRAPLFALLVVASLALGIGANTAIFSVVHAVLLRPLPYDAPDRLVMIWSDNTRQGEPSNPVSPADFEAFRTAPAFDRVEAMYSFLTPSQVRLDGDAELVQALVVAPGMFEVLGRQPILGRTFDSAPDSAGVVISHGYWQRRFNGDANVINRTATVSGVAEPVPILGVMPEDFVFPYKSMLGPGGFTRALTADVWVPLTRARDGRLVDSTGQPNRAIHYLGVIGRLKPGHDIASAERELKAIAAARAAAFPDTNDGWDVTLRSLHEQTVGTVRPALLILLAGVGVVLLISCINVANVLLARAAGRQHDLAIRSALGAPGRRLLQQMLVESVLLAALGGLCGVAVAFAGIPGLLALAPSHLPRLGEVEAGGAVLGFAVAVSMLTGIVVGLLPAISAARTAAHDALRESHRTTGSRARVRVRAGLIVAEVAMATALAIGAGLLVRSFVSVLGVDPGFRADGLLTMQMNVPTRIAGAPHAARLAYYDELEARLGALPGVVSIGGTTRLPLGSTSVTTMLEVDGRAVPVAQRPEVELRREVFEFFRTMDIPIVRGRPFARQDGPGAPLVAVVNTVLASRVFPGEDAIGRRVRLGSAAPDAPWITIVGVVGSVRHGSLEEAPRPEIYLTYRQNAPVAPFLVVRSAGDAAGLAPAVREAIKATGANPPFDVRTMAEIRSSSMSERTFVLLLVGLFGALGLTMAAIGVYGIITLTAAERVAEVGIRLALGASPVQVLTLILGYAVRLAAIGILIGVGIALAGGPWIGSQLFGVGATDPVTYIVVGAALLVVASLAAYLPARRAMRVDPGAVLRPS